MPHSDQLAKARRALYAGPIACMNYFRQYGETPEQTICFD